MSDAHELAALAGAVRELLADHCPPERLAAGDGAVDLALWGVLQGAGLTRVGVAEEAGGSGGGVAEAVTVLRMAGEAAAPVPLAEAGLLAGWLLAVAGLEQPGGIATTGPAQLRVRRDGGGWRLEGSVRRVPAVAEAELLVVPAVGPDGEVVVALAPAGLPRVAGRAVSGETRDDLLVDAPVQRWAAVPPGTAAELRLRGALSRAALIAGALVRVQALTLRYAGERVQFGRPLAAFQAVQQQIAGLAAEAAAADAVVAAAVDAAGEGLGPHTAAAVAAAKVRTAQAATVGARVAHQVHGALGMTHEHVLRFSTTRLGAWRSEWGGEAHWASALADAALGAAGEDGASLWPWLVGA